MGGMDNDEMSETFKTWNEGELDSFLIEISTNILKFGDDSGEFLLEKIRDSAGQKGTGKWTAISALEYGMPVTLIGESVFARCLSSIKAERERASTVLHGPEDTKKSLLKQSVRPCMPVRLFPTHKGSCCLDKQQKNLVGPLIMVELLSCGGVVASLGPGFLEISRLHLTRTQLWIIYYWMISSGMQFMQVRKVGGRLFPRLWSLGSQHLASLQLWHSMMDTGARNYLPI